MLQVTVMNSSGMGFKQTFYVVFVIFYAPYEHTNIFMLVISIVIFICMLCKIFCPLLHLVALMVCSVKRLAVP